MSQPQVPLNAEQQRQLVGQVGQALVVALPPGWRQIRAEYRAVGRHVEADVVVIGPDGTPRPIPPPPEVLRLLGVLRTGMYQPGRGTWLVAVLVFGPVNVLSADYQPDVEPRWRRPPPPIGFQDELRFFPRAEQFIPPWLRQRAGLPAPVPAPAPVPVLTATPPATDAEDLRTPRVYDGLDESGRPVVNREPLPAAEKERVLEYLDSAPVVLAARTYDTDAFDPDRTDAVPLNFRTDGSWLWPGAVAYYLREHEVAPDPELLTHIRALHFSLPEVGEPAKELALTAITGETPA